MTKKKSCLLIAGLSAVFAVSLTAGMGIIASANVSNGWSECVVETEYDYKDTLTIADRTYTVAGKSYNATAIVCYPDGSVSSEKQVTLNQVGMYTIKYSVQAGDKVYAESERFLVNYPAYDVANEKSSVSYGTPERATTAGVQARITQNDALVFTQYIDFTKIKLDDPLVKGYVLPDVAGASDFSELVFTFTDSEDPSVYFQVHHYGYDWTYNTYIAANGQNQVPVGIHQSEGLHTDDGYGLWSYVAFNSVGQAGVVAPDTTQFYLSMDYQAKKVYGLGYPGTTSMIADLDDLSHVKNVWTGFPSGKARLSISAYGYTGATANVCITSVYGIDDLSNNLYIDSGDPVITVDEEYAEEMPSGLKGYDYTIPTATAYDAYAGECKVNVSVWFNYGMTNSVKVPVKDGKFTTDKVGTYGILYEVYDKVGNYSSEVRWVTAYESVSDAEFEIPADKTTSAQVGAWIEVPEINADNITGGSGKKTVKTFIERNGEREEIFGGFRATELGTYKVVYEITDYVGKTTEKFYEVGITAGNTPILENDLDMYPVYISGESYTLPSYYAYYYANGKLERVLCTVVVRDASGENSYTAGETVPITVENNGDKIAFEIVSQGITLAKHEAVGVLAWVQEEAGRRFHVENYLAGEGFGTEKTANGMVLTAAAESGFGFTFANALSSRHVYLKFANVLGADSDTTLRVTLTDALDRKNFVSIVLGNDGGNAYFETEGKKQTFAATPFGGESTFELTYEPNAFVVNGSRVELTSFAGFENQKIFVSVAYENYGENAGITFAELGNCRFNTAQTDRVAPVIISQQETGGSWKPGALYTLHAPIAYDVYSPNMDYTLTVMAPNGNPVKDVNGVLLDKVDPTKDYVIELTEMGEYLVYYSAEEVKSFVSKTNSATLRYSINVVDEIAPTIAWNSAFPTELKVGDTFIVPEYTVTDNYTAAENMIVCVFVETPAHQLLMLPGNSIQMTHEGEYEVRVMVVDQAGNITSETHYITVKGVN